MPKIALQGCENEKNMRFSFADTCVHNTRTRLETVEAVLRKKNYSKKVKEAYAV